MVLNISTPPAGGIHTAVIDTDAGIVYWLARVCDKPKDMDGVDYKRERVAVGIVDVVDGKFPQGFGTLLEQARTQSKAVTEIGMSTVNIGLIEKLAKKFGIKMPFAKLSFNGADKAIRVDFTTPDGLATLIVMPARL